MLLKRIQAVTKNFIGKPIEVTPENKMLIDTDVIVEILSILNSVLEINESKINSISVIEKELSELKLFQSDEVNKIRGILLLLTAVVKENYHENS